MVISSEDAEYLAPFMAVAVESKTASERSGSDDLRPEHDCRNIETSQQTSLADSSSFVRRDARDDCIDRMEHSGRLSKGSMSLNGIDDFRTMCELERDAVSASAVLSNSAEYRAEVSDICSLKHDDSMLSTKKPKKRKGLLRRIRPRLGKFEVANTETGIKNAQIAEEDHSKSMNRCSSIAGNEHSHTYTKVRLFGRPPIPRKTFQLHQDSSLKDLECVTESDNLTLVDDGATTVSIMTVDKDFEVKIEDGKDENFKLKENIAVDDSMSTTSAHRIQRAKLAGRVTDGASACTEQRSVFGRNHAKKERKKPQDDAQSASMPLPNLLTNESLQPERQPVHIAENEENKISTTLEIGSESAIPSDAHSVVPEFLLPSNQLQHVSSDITFNSIPARAQDMSNRSPYEVPRLSNQTLNRQIENGREQNHIPPSPVFEALQYAKSQAGRLNSKFNEEDIRLGRVGQNKRAAEAISEDHTSPRSFGCDFQSVKGQLRCGMNDVMYIIDPEWDGDEFGKGKRNNQQSDAGQKVADAIRSLRVHLACGTFGDVMNTVGPDWRDSHRPEYEAEKANETQPKVPREFPDVTASRTISALRSQLACGILDNAVNDADSGWKKSDHIHSRSNYIEEEKTDPTVDAANRSASVSAEQECCSTDYKESSKEDETDVKSKSSETQTSLMSARGRGPKIRHFETQHDDERALDTLDNAANSAQSERINDTSKKDAERLSLPSESSLDTLNAQANKRRNSKSQHNQKDTTKKHVTDDESQMIFSHFSGDTPVINNYRGDKTKAQYLNSLRNSLRKNLVDVEAAKESQAKTSKVTVKRQIQQAENKTKVDSPAKTAPEEKINVTRDRAILLQEKIEEEDDAIPTADEQSQPESLAKEVAAEDEEQSICTATLERFQVTNAQIIRGTNKVSDVQLVLSASSTLELPKHKRSSVIRFAPVPAEIRYEREKQDEAERRNAQKQIQLAKRAVISSQYMDHFDPCLRIFDPALDACDKFCTRSPSLDSDDECSIASASICGDKPRLGLRQRAYNYIKETPVWPRSGKPRKVKAPNRLA